jgi:predicted nucleic acid-binding protein
MISAVDTNVIFALWDADERGHLTALDLLDDAASRGGIVICGAVFGELLACPGRTEEFINKFLEDAEIVVDWATTEAVWRTAGSAFHQYAARRRRQQSGDPRRILTDFYIGAHAFENGHNLLTLDDGIYRASFPKLKIFRI